MSLLTHLCLDEILAAGHTAEQVVSHRIGLGGGQEELLGGGAVGDHLVEPHKAAGHSVAVLVPDGAADGAVIGPGVYLDGHDQIGGGAAGDGGGHGGGGQIAVSGGQNGVDAVGHVVEQKLAVGGGVGGGHGLAQGVEQGDLGAAQGGGGGAQNGEDAGHGAQGQGGVGGAGEGDLGGVAVGEGDPHGGAHEIALGHGGHAVGAGGDVVQTVGAGGVGHGVLVGEAGAVKELDGGVRDGGGAVGDGAVYRGQNAGGGGRTRLTSSSWRPWIWKLLLYVRP